MQDAPYAAREDAVQIQIGRGDHIALIDRADEELIRRFRWHRIHGRQTYYAVTHHGRGTTIYMHRLLVGLERGDPRQVDHINRDGLDNRRSNLRIVTAAQQRHNTGAYRNKKDSIHRGVFYNRRTKRWYGQVQCDYIVHNTGCFDTEPEANIAVKALRRELLSHAVD